MSKHYPKIQLRRSKIDYANEAIQDTILDYGEPLFLSSNNYLVIGGAGSTEDTKKVSVQRMSKIYGKDIVDDSLFYQRSDSFDDYGTVFLINDEKQILYLISTGIKRTDGTSMEEDLTNIWEELARLDRVKAPIAGPTFTKEGSKWPESVTPDFYDNSTKIATTAFVNNLLMKSEFKTTGTGTNKHWYIPKTQSTSIEKLYLCGVSEANGALYYCGSNASAQAPGSNTAGVYVNCKTGVMFGAAWNDFAEFRECSCKAGTVVCETGKGDLLASSERLQAGASVVSDTYGMVIGINSPTSAPIALAGRVLAYYSGSKKDYKPGAAVCADANGKMSVMTRDEIKEYPDRILGYVSEIPSKKTWKNISTEGRIWIKVK